MSEPNWSTKHKSTRKRPKKGKTRMKKSKRLTKDKLRQNQENKAETITRKITKGKELITRITKSKEEQKPGKGIGKQQERQENLQAVQINQRKTRDST